MGTSNMAVVCLDDIAMMNNFQCLPPRWSEQGIEAGEVFCAKTEALKNYSSKLIHSVYDVVISPRFVSDDKEPLTMGYTGLFNNILFLYRYPKPMQQHFCQMAFEKVAGEHGRYLEVPEFEYSYHGFFTIPYPKAMDGNVITLAYLIKPNAGARSIGILEIQGGVHCPRTIGKIIDANEKLEDFKQAIEKEWLDSEIVSKENLKDDIFIDTMEGMTEEGYRALRGQGFFIQQKIKVKKEWRVIFQIKDIKNPKAGYDFYVFKREHGKPKLDKRNFNHIDAGLDVGKKDENIAVEAYLTQLLLDAKQFFGSLDLFKSSDGRYGVFEFSNQFGTEDNNGEFFESLHKEFIAKAINGLV